MIRLRLVINCLVTSYFFGMWQQSFYAAGFMMLALGAVLSMIDYAKATPQRSDHK